LLVATGQAKPKLVIFHWIKALSLFFQVILTVPTQLPAFPDGKNHCFSLKALFDQLIDLWVIVHGLQLFNYTGAT
jgi:hypothetical protein